MKRILALTLLLLSLFITPCSYGAGTVTGYNTFVKVSSTVGYIEFFWTADSALATIPATVSCPLEGYVILIETDPGTTAPTALYDITLVNDYSIDVAGGALADRSATVSEAVYCKTNSSPGGRWVWGTLTLNISNNLVNSATGKVRVWIERPAQ